MGSVLSREGNTPFFTRIQEKAKALIDFIKQETFDFRTLHSDFELILVSLTLVLIPPYFINGHTFDLLDEIKFIINNQEADFVILISRGAETILLLSGIVILLNYYFSKEESIQEANAKYMGSHGCLTISKVPSHLVYNEIKPTEESASIYNSGFEGVGMDELDFIASNPQTVQLTKDAEAYTKAYQEFFSADIQLPQPQQQQGPRYVSLADLLGAGSDEFTINDSTTNP